MPLPQTSELINAGFKGAVSTIRNHIEAAGITGLRKEEQMMIDAINALRAELPARIARTHLPKPSNKPQNRPSVFKIEQFEHPELISLKEDLSVQEAVVLKWRCSKGELPKVLLRKRKELKSAYEKKVVEIFLSSAKPHEIASYHQNQEDLKRWDQSNQRYDKEKRAYLENLRIHKARVNSGRCATNRNSTNETQHRVLDNLTTAIERKLAGNADLPISGKLTWELLPKGSLGLSDLNCFIEEHGISRREGFERTRLEFAFSLKPERVFVGRSEFDGYFVFEFTSTGRVLLENPFYGNAAFVFHSDWKPLAKLSRTELTLHYRGKVDRIIHSGPSSNWKQEIKRCLNLTKDTRPISRL